MGRIIKFQGKASKAQGPYRCIPIPDGKGWYLGVERITDQIKNYGEAYIVPVDPNDTDKQQEFWITDGVTLDLDNTYDRLVYEYLKHDKYVVRSAADFEDNPNALYCETNEEQILEDSVNLKKEKLKLQTWIISLSHEKRQNICRLMGTYTAGATEMQVLDELLAKCEETASVPGRKTKGGFFVLSQIRLWMDSGRAQIRIFLKRLLEQKLVFCNKNGEYSYGTGSGSDRVIIGMTEDQALAWLDRPENRGVVAYFMSQLGDDFARTEIENERKDVLARQESNRIVTAEEALYKRKGSFDELVDLMEEQKKTAEQEIKPVIPTPAAEVQKVTRNGNRFAKNPAAAGIPTSGLNTENATKQNEQASLNRNIKTDASEEEEVINYTNLSVEEDTE